MLIKSTVRGNPIPYTPSEALPYAVEYGVKGMNDNDTIYWALRDTIKSSACQHIAVPSSDKRGRASWEANASGSVVVGRTATKTDKFFQPKKYNFVIRYKSALDTLGLPDIEVLDFKLTQTK
jgi:hypothetical protein